jgi:hypothetical protein
MNLLISELNSNRRRSIDINVPNDRNHQKDLLRFITRRGMYIRVKDDENVVSFIHGYELGTKNKCNFTQQLKLLLTNKV